MLPISVIIPVYNSEKTLVECITSILNQNYTNLQIVFVDDGSKDDSKSIIQKFLAQKNFSSYKYIYQENSGPAKARQTAIENSDNQYIAFLDSDDVWDDFHLSRLEEAMTRTNADLVCTSKNLNIKNEMQINLNKMLKRCYVQSSTLLIKKEVVIKIPFRTNKRYSEDYDLWLRLSANNKRIVVLPFNDVTTIEQKSNYGDSGLSKNLWKMESNELENFVNLFKNKYISIFKLFFVSVYSFAKYILRLLKTGVKLNAK